MRTPSLRALALVCGLAAAATTYSIASASAPDSADFLDRYSATRGFRSGQPTSIAIPRDGSEVLFLRSGPRDRVQSLWSFDPRTGTEREVLTGARLLGGAEETLSPEERARRERLRMTARGLSSFQLSKDGARVLIPFSGRLFLMERPGGAVRELGAAGGATAPAPPPPDHARLAPDGTQLRLVPPGAMGGPAR